MAWRMRDGMHTQLFEGADFLNTNLYRPRFLPVVSTEVLAKALLKAGSDGIDGFIVEKNKAGGHNAPPRRKAPLSDTHEPVYGPKDEVDLVHFSALGKPFWVAGGTSLESLFGLIASTYIQ